MTEQQEIIQALVEQFGFEVLRMYTTSDEAKQDINALGFGEDAFILESNAHAAKFFEEMTNLALPDGITQDAANPAKMEAAALRSTNALQNNPHLLGEVFVLEGYINSLIKLRTVMISTIIKNKIAQRASTAPAQV